MGTLHYRHLLACVCNSSHIFLSFCPEKVFFECKIMFVNLITFRKGMPNFLFQKKVNPKNTIYEIKDGTGNIEVVGSEQCYNISCKEGDKVRLFCFQVKTIDKQPKLVSGDHSFIKVRSRREQIYQSRNSHFIRILNVNF